jgi:hypothetical protein
LFPAMLFAVWQVQSSVPGVGPELALRACSAVNSGHVLHTVVTKGRCKGCLRPSNRRAIRIQVAATLDFGDTNGCACFVASTAFHNLRPCSVTSLGCCISIKFTKIVLHVSNGLLLAHACCMLLAHFFMAINIYR